MQHSIARLARARSQSSAARRGLQRRHNTRRARAALSERGGRPRSRVSDVTLPSHVARRAADSHLGRGGKVRYAQRAVRTYDEDAQRVRGRRQRHRLQLRGSPALRRCGAAHAVRSAGERAAASGAGAEG